MSKENITIVIISALISYVFLMLVMGYPEKLVSNPEGFKEIPSECYALTPRLISCTDYSKPMPKWLVWCLAEHLHKSGK